MRRSMIVLFLLTMAPAAAQTRIQAFTYTPRKDEITDEDRSTLITSELRGTVMRNAALAWRCDGSSPRVYVLADEFLNATDPVPIRWRFDSDPPSPVMWWTVSTVGTVAFAPDDLVDWFSRRARRASRVIIRVEDYRGVEYTLEFSLAGLTAGLRQLACFSEGGPATGRVVSDELLGPKALFDATGVGVDLGGRLAFWCEDDDLTGAFTIWGLKTALTAPVPIINGTDVRPSPLKLNDYMRWRGAARLARLLVDAASAEVAFLLPDASEARLRFNHGQFAALDDLPCAGAMTEADPVVNYPIVGNPNKKVFFSTRDDCWRAYATEQSAVFFQTAEDAIAQGYRRSGLCR